jgi:hypothetical protein
MIRRETVSFKGFLTSPISRRVVFYFIALSISLLAIMVLQSSSVAAFPGGTSRHGYFSGNEWQCNLSSVQCDKLWGRGNDGFDSTGFSPSSVNNIDEFVDFYDELVNRSGQAYTIAAFAILTMLGEPAGTSRSVARDRFDEWEQLVRAYDSRNLIDFNVPVTYTRNTLYDPSRNDVMFYNLGSPDQRPTVVFYHPSGDGTHAYEIKRDCANPLGDMQALPDIQTRWRYVMSDITYGNNLDTSSATASNPVRHRPGTAVQMTSTITNTRDGEGEVHEHRFQVRFGANSNAWEQPALSGGTGRNPIAAGASRSRTQTYTLPSDVQNDTRVCFRAYVTPVDGQSEPVKTITNDGHRFSDVRCVRIYIQPPSITTASATCDRFTWNFSADSGSGSTYQWRLQERVGSNTVNRTGWSSTSPGGTNKTPPLTSYRDFGERRFRVQVRYTGSMQGINTASSSWQDVGPCASISCGNLVTSPSPVEAGQEFSAEFNFGVHNYGTAGRSAEFSVEIDGTGVSGTGPMNFNSPITPGTASSRSSGITLDGMTVDDAGTYELRVTVTGLPGTLVCPDGDEGYEVVAYDMPYVSAFGADVIASEGFVDNCSTNSGLISTLFDPSDGNNRGSGAQFAVQAMTQINGFASAKMRSSVPAPTKGLTFANTGGSPADTTYGGGFPLPHCSMNWYDFAVQTMTVNQNTGNAQSAYNNANNTTADGETHVVRYTEESMGASSRTLNNSKSMVLLRNGDLYIRANLTYTNDSWASANQIPALYFLVNGDIYIHNDVTQLDGIFFATGSVYTCATG